MAGLYVPIKLGELKHKQLILEMQWAASLHNSSFRYQMYFLTGRSSSTKKDAYEPLI
jgi:hypothetical protein